MRSFAISLLLAALTLPSSGESAKNKHKFIQ